LAREYIFNPAFLPLIVSTSFTHCTNQYSHCILVRKIEEEKVVDWMKGALVVAIVAEEKWAIA